jgi:hypothetical protein
MTATIRDINGQARTWEWLHSVYGPVAQLYAPDDSEFELFEIWAMCSPGAGNDTDRSRAFVDMTQVANGWVFAQTIKGVTHSLYDGTVDPGAVIVARVLDENGAPLEGIEIARWWPDDTLPELPPELATWHNKGVHGKTDGGGCVGFGMGKGDYYTPANGPAESAVWTFGDALAGIGMVAGTSHWTLWPVFKRRGDVPTPEPPLDGDVSDEIRAYLTEIEQALAGIGALLT